MSTYEAVMSKTFTKLFSDITSSTIWCEPERTRLVWITMLAMADRHGRVFASMPGLAHQARVPEIDCQIALECFLSPDRHSRTQEKEGRRIEPIDGGWRLINYDKYREIRDEESVRETKKQYMRNVRAKAGPTAPRTVTINAETVNLVNKEVDTNRKSGTPWIEAEAEADAVKQSTASPAAQETLQAAAKQRTVPRYPPEEPSDPEQA